MLKKTNIVTVVLVAVGSALSLYHFAMGYGLENHMYVGLSGGFCIAIGMAFHKLFAVAD